MNNYNVTGSLFLLAPNPWRITALVIINPPITTGTLGISLMPNKGSQTHKTPPTTSIKDNRASSAAGKYFAPRLNKINPLATIHPCNKLKLLRM